MAPEEKSGVRSLVTPGGTTQKKQWEVQDLTHLGHPGMILPPSTFPFMGTLGYFTNRKA